MKKRVFLIGLPCIIILILLSIFIYKYYQIKNAVIIVELKEPLETEFLSKVKVSDFIENINGTIINDYSINTESIGMKEIKFEYINEDNIKIKYSYDLKIVDTTSPVVWLGGSYTVTIGSDINLIDEIMCGDNYDNNPTCEIIGEYDMNIADTYPLVFKATDESGNITEKSFNLRVIDPTKKTNNTSKSTTTPKTTSTPAITEFSDVIKNYKTSETEIGIDISEWQGDVDFEMLKSAGVEFVIIRVGGTKGINGEYFLDSKFKEYIKGATEAKIPVGVYFFSYANSKKNAINDALWVLKQIKGYKIDLPIAFDWENWSFYNDFNLSFFGLTDMANSFLNVFASQGYEGMIYSSKTYLESIWLETNHQIWLAHYAKNTSYEGDFSFWQICDNGRVDGINGNVDINIRYK